MKKQILFWRRFFSTIIDISLIYALSILLQFIVWQFNFVHFGILFIASFLIYYIAFYSISSGKTPAKILTGLQIIRNDTDKINFKNIFLREIVLKAVIGLLLPLYLYEKILPFQMILFLVIFYALALLFSIIILLVFRLNWWDLLSNTRCIKSVSTSSKELKYSIYSISFILLASIFIIVYPFVLENAKLQTSFYPKYPVDSETKEYADFIKHNSKNPVDYIFDLFNKYDFVVLSERMHPEHTQYDLITKIVSDKRFINSIGNIFTECGSVSFQDTLNTYLTTKFINEEHLNRSTAVLQRNSNGVWPLWDNTNLFDFLKIVNKLNNNLPDSQKIHWYFTDLSVDWDKMTNKTFLEHYSTLNRDSIMAENIIQVYDDIISKQKNKKALVIMNTRHGYGLLDKRFGNRIIEKGTTGYLMSNYPGKVANILLNTVTMKYWMMFTPLQNGKWDAAFTMLGNPTAGFDFVNSPFGNDNFDAFIKTSSNLKYKDVFTGFIFYKPLEEHILKHGFLYEFDDFEIIILKRAAYVDAQQVETIKELIDRYKKNPKNPVFTDNTDYADLYNLVNIIYVPIFLFCIIIISLALYVYSLKKLTPKKTTIT